MIERSRRSSERERAARWLRGGWRVEVHQSSVRIGGRCPRAPVGYGRDRDLLTGRVLRLLLSEDTVDGERATGGL